MSAQVITTEYVEYADRFPVQPWQHVVATASQASATPDGAAAGAAESAVPRKASDRGASAVEWVVITGIVVAIVAGVGWAISNAISKKATNACNQINSAGNNVSVTGGGGNGGGNAGGTTAGTTGGSGCN
jgi:Flp pilus assembly pilin Flp